METPELHPEAAALTPEQVLADRRLKHKLKMKRYFDTHPEQRKRKSERVCERYWNDPEYQARVKARSAQVRADRKATLLAPPALVTV
jgi:hypothetical protein